MKISVIIYKLAGLMSEIGDKEVFLDSTGELKSVSDVATVSKIGEPGIMGICLTSEPGPVKQLDHNQLNETPRAQ